MKTDKQLEEKQKLGKQLVDAIDRKDLYLAKRCIRLKADVNYSSARKLND